MISDKEKAAYLAGLFDGEGSIRIEPTGQFIQLRIANKNLEVIKWVKNNFGGTIEIDAFKRKEGYKKNIHYSWQMGNAAGVKKFLKMVQPYLIIRYQKCTEALDHFEDIGK